MHGIKPRTLSNAELVKYSAMFLDSNQQLPNDWAIELVRRFNALAPLDSTPTVDPRQLELPL